MTHILDTDFQKSDRIHVYLGGREVFDGKVSDANEQVKDICDVSDWYMLDPSCESYQAIFVA